MVSPSSGCDHHKDAYAAPKHRRERRVRTVEAVERRDEPEQPRNCELALARKLTQLADGRELGRASCRERVWQYVEMSVVAVALKKTADKHNRRQQKERYSDK